MSLAVIKTGGKQYLVAPGDKIKVETLKQAQGELVEIGKEFIFEDVLLLEKSKKLEVGTPTIKDAKVTAKILKHGRGEKVVALRYKAKKRISTKKGHRQNYTEVEITKVV